MRWLLLALAIVCSGALIAWDRGEGFFAICLSGVDKAIAKPGCGSEFENRQHSAEHLWFHKWLSIISAVATLGVAPTHCKDFDAFTAFNDELDARLGRQGSCRLVCIAGV